MAELDELTALALTVSDLTLLVREQIGHNPGAPMPTLEPRMRDGEAFWVATTAVRRVGAHQLLWAEGRSAMTALGRLRAALSDMAEGRRAVIGGEAEKPVPVAARRPYPAPGQVWSFERGPEYREVVVTHVLRHTDDGRERAGVRNLLTDRKTYVLTETLSRPGSGWSFLRMEA